MLRINQNSSAVGAMGYYTQADYYSEGQELVGGWKGETAKRLGLTGDVQKDVWDALCQNLHPATGQTLTQRQKEHRRVGYDFNFHVPKSVSLLYGLTKDERVLDAFRESVQETMRDIEAEMKTRVRKQGKDEDRITGNMIWGEFVHFTSRPVDGVPDPHLHAHCFVFNTTWDSKENIWKAGQFSDLKRDAPYFEAKFHSRMGRRMAELGVGIERTKTGWEVAGVPATALKRFSRRTTLIEAEAERMGIHDPRAKSQLGAATRKRKQKHLTIDQLHTDWQSRLTNEERLAISAVHQSIGGPAIGEERDVAHDALRYAAAHCFERKAVVPERTLLAQAIRYAVGRVSPEAVEDAFRQSDFVWGDKDGRRMVTTRSVLSEETKMLAFARDGRGTEVRFSPNGHVFKRGWLNAGQRKAVEHVLGSRDHVILIRGAAGVGKTSMMQEAVEAIETEGRRVFAFAPSADSSRGVLRSEGFGSADTVARLLADERLQQNLYGQVIWIDEAGLLGTKTMAEVFDLAERFEARVILSGDRRQHGSVERGSPLRLLEEEAGLVSAEIKDIQRQKGNYKQAVQLLSDGRIEDGFKQLDGLGWVREVADDDRCQILAKDYVATVAAGKTALVVSPTHREGERITAEIRDLLKRKGQLMEVERTVLQLVNANLTEAERADPVNYFPGDVVEFHQNAKGFYKGERAVVNGQKLPLEFASRFQTFKSGELCLAVGDLVRITKNGVTADGKHRLNNGARYSVKAFGETGDIVLDNGWIVAKDYGHLAHGYARTSHSSQGQTVDHVLIGQSAESFPASSREQFYVSVSRGKQKATIYTDDKKALLTAISRSDDRLSATEFVDRRERAALMQRQEAMSQASHDLSSHYREERKHDR